MPTQCTSIVLMVRPSQFGYDEETAEDNAFQCNPGDESKTAIQQNALEEFDEMVRLLRDYAIEVVVMEDTPAPAKPDAVFPNNWISFHENGSIITYAMRAKRRRAERREDIIEQMSQKFGFDRRYSLEHYEEKGQFLESTGSMVLDRVNRVVYACISERTNPLILDKFCALTGYERIVFEALDSQGQAIFHTNVMMCIGQSFAVICSSAIPQDHDRLEVTSRLESCGKAIIDITFEQLQSFAGNMIHVMSKKGESLIILSEQAFRSLTPHQVDVLKLHGNLLPVSIPTIERVGGGSVRCMMAEVFTPPIQL